MQTTVENRLEKGEQTQIDIFGEGMRGFAESGPEETKHINRWLTDNCFGDYYTRTGLDYKMREMITFCFLSAWEGASLSSLHMQRLTCVLEMTRRF